MRTRHHPRGRIFGQFLLAAAATAWTFANIERLGGSRDRIILAGASAGGYLAAMVALDPTYLAPHSLHPNQLGLASIGGQMINHVAVREEQGITR
ncbi:MAG: alpha/beta hydrolase fold domain-containing protein, partial [Planctomycetota bacterium]